MNLFTRFFLILLAFALAPVLATGVWILNSSAAVRENAQQLHRQVAQLTADTVEASALEINRGLSFVEDIQLNAGRNPALDYKLLQRAVITHPSFVLLSLLDASGRETQRLADVTLFPRLSYEDR